MTYWKFGGGYSYRTPGSKKTQWAKTLSQVPASAKGPKRSSPSRRKSGGAKMAKRRKATSKKKGRSSRILGALSLKGALIGGLTYFGVSSILPQVGGAYAPAVTKVATGLTAKAIGVPGAMMTGAGIIEAVAIAVGQVLSGSLRLPFIGGGNGNGATGYDY